MASGRQKNEQPVAGPTKVRVAVKAVIVHQGRLLTVKVRDLLHKDVIVHSLPGGGQRPGENLHEAMLRECREEIGVSVDVGDVLFVRDYIGLNHGRVAVDAEFHQVELFFACSLRDDGDAQRVGAGVAPDERQVGVEWVPLARLAKYNFRPKALLPLLHTFSAGGHRRPVYLGDVD